LATNIEGKGKLYFQEKVKILKKEYKNLHYIKMDNNIIRIRVIFEASDYSDNIRIKAQNLLSSTFKYDWNTTVLLLLLFPNIIRRINKLTNPIFCLMRICFGTVLSSITQAELNYKSDEIT
jgi:hypothetical protein